MSDDILKVENLSKQYRLGTVGTGTMSHDLNRWWHKIRGKEDPYLKIGETNDRSKKGESDYAWALRDINFEVKRGEVLGIIGKNGAGKSTLLKILSRVTSPTTGEIKTKGRIASLLEVGTGFHPELTGRENIYLNGAILGMTKAEITSKEQEIIEFSGCERYIDTPVKRYSSGMRVRLAFAVAAHLEPDILVVDEVLAVGDAEFQKKAIGKMQDISKGQGKTVLFVSHNMTAVQNLCTRAIVLVNGEVQFSGKTDDAIKFHLKSSSDINDLEEVVRKGSQELVLSKINLSNKNDSFLISGSPALIEFIFVNKTKNFFDNIRFDFRIDDYLGQRLFWFSTSMFNEKIIIKDEKVTIAFDIPKLHLNSGTYYMTTHLSGENGVIDWAQNIVKFDVGQGDFYKSGKDVPILQSKTLEEYSIYVK